MWHKHMLIMLNPQIKAYSFVFLYNLNIKLLNLMATFVCPMIFKVYHVYHNQNYSKGS